MPPFPAPAESSEGPRSQYVSGNLRLLSGSSSFLLNLVQFHYEIQVENMELAWVYKHCIF